MELSDQTLESLKKDIEKALSDDTSLKSLALDSETLCKYRAVITPFVVGLATASFGKVGGFIAQTALDKWYSEHCH
ncbi:hypothetical protein M2426_001265 [Pseudomonas moraviensis]|uniref:hypothetical protein n=1 Tax=Pseudomonas moraviensis TaxID=321662 RepID=UPI003D19218D